METSDYYGALSGLRDTEQTNAGGFNPMQQQDEPSDKGEELWSYQRLGKINGVPVRECDRGLKISTQSLLTDAFVLDRKPHSYVFYVKPEDNESLALYNDILDKVHEGTVEIIDELRQFSSSKEAFLVWIRYNELLYVLNERYNWLHEE